GTVEPPSGVTLAPGSDTDLKGDNITTATRPIVTGTGVPGDGVTLRDGATVIGTSPVGQDGSWGVFPSTLAPGVHSMTAIQSDAVGHVSGPSETLSLMILVPSPSGLVLSPLTDTGAQGDNITTATKPIITGS